MKSIVDFGPNQNIFLGYWETIDYRQWGIAEDLTEKGLRIRSHLDMPVGGQMKINVFFCVGNGFRGFPILTRIAKKEFPCIGGFEEGYEYELEFVEISGKELRNLRVSCQDSGGNRRICS